MDSAHHSSRRYFIMIVRVMQAAQNRYNPRPAALTRNKTLNTFLGFDAEETELKLKSVLNSSAQKFEKIGNPARRGRGPSSRLLRNKVKSVSAACASLQERSCPRGRTVQLLPWQPRCSRLGTPRLASTHHTTAGNNKFQVINCTCGRRNSGP